MPRITKPLPSSKAVDALRDALLAVIVFSAACAGETATGSADGALLGAAGGASGAGGTWGGAGIGAGGYGALCEDVPGDYYPFRGGEVCYIAPAIDGVAQCPAQDDPTLPKLLSSSSSTTGNSISVRSVVGVAPSRPLSPACVAQAHCCEAQTGVDARMTCQQHTRGAPGDPPCAGFSLNRSGESVRACDDLEPASVIDRGLCCYYACGAAYGVGRPLITGERARIAVLVSTRGWVDG